MIFPIKIFPIILAWAFVKGNTRKDKILFLQKSSIKDSETLLVMTWTENDEEIKAGCEIFTDKMLINEALSSNEAQIRTLSEDEMQILIGDCQEFNHQRRKRDVENSGSTGLYVAPIEDDPDELTRTNRRSNRRRGSRNRTSNRSRKEQEKKLNGTITTREPSTTVSLNEIADEYEKTDKQKYFRNRTNSEREHESEEAYDMTLTATTEPATTVGYDGLPIIFPGTKWCGAGAVAENVEDLGAYNDTDHCCRAHDLCNDTLAPGETRNNLKNTSPFTKLCCRCDEEFYNCLRDVKSIPANTIGNMYFNVLRRECYEFDYPPSKTCKKYLTLFKLTCLEYEKDMTKEQIYQWVKPKRYPLI